jgi:hypothetical protein
VCYVFSTTPFHATDDVVWRRRSVLSLAVDVYRALPLPRRALDFAVVMMMKTRIPLLLILVLTVVLCGTACRGREQPAPAPTATAYVPPPAGQAPPAAPTNCKATQIDTRTIRVEWQFTGQTDGFRVYQGKTSLEATVGAGARSWTIADLPGGVQHHFDVRAYNASGESRADACSVDVTRR